MRCIDLAVKRFLTPRYLRGPLKFPSYFMLPSCSSQIFAGQLAAALGDASARDYVTIREIVAASDERDERVPRLTAMGREFVNDVRHRARAGGVAALLAEPPTLHERVLE